ncbi:sigma-70 family RNA polymerase sigma factor [Pasteurellaceae bacterium LIM206]|nr:sigma-70 family RNA polymerase sigma factor [Pasteurellaceae bacterium LIM206]
MLQKDVQINELREQMLKFARLQIRDDEAAEDLVQETFASALKNIDSFQGKAALKTWIFAILKNKIIDYLRLKGRFVIETELSGEHDTNHFFDENEHWVLDLVPGRLPSAEHEAYNEEFWLIFEACLTHLPAQQARVFMMREYLELESGEICAETQISSSNLYTLLYRARLQLQHCLTKRLDYEV